MSRPIPDIVRERQPLIDSAGMAMLDRLQQHRHAPLWNHGAGDRVTGEDLEALDRLRTRFEAPADRGGHGRPPVEILDRIADLRGRVPAFAEAIPVGVKLEDFWPEIPTMSREDVAVRPERFVPDDQDLDRLIVYRTAGTTGHALLVPHHPRAAAAYCVFLEQALGAYGIEPDFSPEQVACFLIGAQARTVTYPCVLSAWKQAGFAKLNLNPGDWRDPADPAGWFEDLDPVFLTGDPISYHELMRREIPTRPRAMVSTAVAMSDGLRARLAEHFGCPVIDWYSLTETGPIAFMDGDGGYRVLPPDLWVEAVDPEGRPVPDGERGEITVTGGRNPFLPLLRYRTGDWGRLERRDDELRIHDLEGRAPVLFRAASGDPVNPVDLSRVLRAFPLVQHELTQRADRSVELVLRPIAGREQGGPDIEAALRELLGDLPMELRWDPTLGDRKVVPYRSELLFED